MIGQGTTEIFITFLLAIIGYAGLTVTLILSLKNKPYMYFWRVISLIILIHVFMVWNYRYSFDFSLSVRNGYGGFILFHSSLIIILVSAFVKEKLSKTLIIISFFIVTSGAVGASFRYDVVAVYKIPVLVCAAIGFTGFLYSIFSRKI